MRRLGFSLVELSIVLVILGLLVGGILGGQSLIQAAEVHSQIAQVEKLRLAINAFRGKYNFLPGDLPPEIANSAGFATRSRALYGSAYGDGRLTGAMADYLTTQPSYEVPLFWADLGHAQLIEGTYLGIECAYGAGGCTTTDTTPLENIIFKAKLTGNYITMFHDLGFVPSETGKLQFLFVGPMTVSINGNWGNQQPGMSPQHAFGIDKKLDDGLPQSGTVLSRRIDATGGAWALTPSGWGGSSCNTNSVYTLANDGPVCGISIRY